MKTEVTASDFYESEQKTMRTKRKKTEIKTNKKTSNK